MGPIIYRVGKQGCKKPIKWLCDVSNQTIRSYIIVSFAWKNYPEKGYREITIGLRKLEEKKLFGTIFDTAKKRNVLLIRLHRHRRMSWVNTFKLLWFLVRSKPVDTENSKSI